MDIFFISFRESNAEQNWLQTKHLHPNAIRLHGIKGIDKVHLICNDIANTDYFWTIDGDNYLIDSLNYDYGQVDTDLIMFKALDALDKLPTALGGLKLWRKNKIVIKDMSTGDFSLNATKNKKVTDTVLSESRYNSSPFDAWKTSFRHCVKLSSIIFRSRPNAKNLDSYLMRWSNTCNLNEPNSAYAYKGYLDALEYAGKFDNNWTELLKINDYDWLREYYDARVK